MNTNPKQLGINVLDNELNIHISNVIFKVKATDTEYTLTHSIDNRVIHSIHIARQIIDGNVTCELFDTNAEATAFHYTWVLDANSLTDDNWYTELLIVTNILFDL